MKRIIVQRVFHPKTLLTGINTFVYDTTFDATRGELQTVQAEVYPSGNQVRSYLYVTAPDDMQNDVILAMAFEETERLMSSNEPLPWVFSKNDVSVEFSLKQSLAHQWQIELRVLLGYAMQVRSACLRESL